MLHLPARWRSAGQARVIVANQLKARHFLRLHAFMLFGWTFGIAYLMSQLAFAADSRSNTLYLPPFPRQIAEYAALYGMSESISAFPIRFSNCVVTNIGLLV